MTDMDEKPGGGLRLILLRHAKSAWPDGIADKKRPLSERGRKAAPAMGRYMEQEGLVPELVLVSTAERTQQTWLLVKQEFSRAPEARNLDAIYEAPSETLLSALRQVEAGRRCIAMIGHNPGMEDLAALLTGDGDAAARQAMAEKYPTAGLAVIDFDCSGWQEIGAATGRLERFVTPRSLDRAQPD